MALPQSFWLNAPWLNVASTNSSPSTKSTTTSSKVGNFPYSTVISLRVTSVFFCEMRIVCSLPVLSPPNEFFETTRTVYSPGLVGASSVHSPSTKYSTLDSANNALESAEIKPPYSMTKFPFASVVILLLESISIFVAAPFVLMKATLKTTIIPSTIKMGILCFKTKFLARATLRIFFAYES